MNRRVARLIIRAQRRVDRPWFLPALAGLAFIDLFCAVIPTDGLLISSVLLRPKRWLSMFLWTTTGSGLGAVALSLVVHALGEPLANRLLADAMASPNWIKTTAFLTDHGGWALGAMAFGPLPQQPAVVVCALAQMPLMTIFLAVWIGRGVKYGAFAWAAAYAPDWFKKFGKSASREAKEISQAKKLS